VLGTNITADPDEGVRKTSHEALLRLEQWVLENGFLPLVAKRNEFARAQGFKDYFEYRIHKNERLSYGELFGILQEFEFLTRTSCQALLKSIAAEKGPQAILGHNVKFAAAGDAEARLDPYFPFARSLETWAKTFSRLGIRYRGAQLTLDLFDRKGKYENGFMHGPRPCFFDPASDYEWRPSRINFTSNATPTQVGSGRRALTTLFHEGAHAAHFSNITQDAPCFSMEYPPTSMAYAETQSMFCDSLVGDADWMKLYARDKDGGAIPDEAVRFALTLDHPFQTFMERQLLLVPCFESRMYRMSDAERTPAAVTALARSVEKEILGVECSPRPVLSVPHLLGAESACSYQGYLLAHMAVTQTRSHLLKKYGYLADNPAIGPELAEHYWNPGNSKSHDETIRSLTGERLSGRPLAEHCNLSNEALWVHSREQMRKAAARKPLLGEAELDAVIRIVHGKEEIAASLSGMKGMSEAFAAWVARWPSR
jgi:oligoendopeptidase F